MNKEIEALECLETARKVLTKMFGKEILDEEGINFDIIKQALIQAEKDRKELENPLNIRPCKDAKNKAESFELILFKNVDLNLIRPSANAESYNSKIPYYRKNLTNNEFKFLKEIIRQSLLQQIEVEE